MKQKPLMAGIYDQLYNDRHHKNVINRISQQKWDLYIFKKTMQTKSQSPKKQQDYPHYLRDTKNMQQSNPKKKLTTFDVNPEVYDEGQ